MLIVSSLHNSIGTELNNTTDIIKFIFDLILKRLLIACVTWKWEDRRRLGEEESLLEEKAACCVVSIYAYT